MTASEIMTWAFQGLLAIGLLYLAFRKAPAEQKSLNGSTLESYAKSAQIAGDGLEKANIRIQEMAAAKEASDVEFERRLRYLEKGAAYKVSFQFTIGEFPTITNMAIKPILSDEPVSKP